MVSILLWLCVLNCSFVKLNVEGNDDYQLWCNVFSLAHTLSFNATIKQASSKPKFFTHELLFSFPFYVFILLFLWFQISWVMNNNQQNKMRMCAFVILLLWWFISLLWVFPIVLVVVVMLCMWGLGFLCSMKIPIVRVFKVLHHPSLASHILPWILMFPLKLIVKLFMCASLANRSKELTHLML